MTAISSDDAILHKFANLWGATWNKVTPEKQQMLVSIWKELEDGSTRWKRARL